MRKQLPFLLLGTAVLGTSALIWAGGCLPAPRPAHQNRTMDPSEAKIVQAFGKQGIRINGAEAAGIRANVRIALQEARLHGLGNSKVDFAAVEIAQALGLDCGPGSNTVRNIVSAIGGLRVEFIDPAPTSPMVDWSTYFDKTVKLWDQPGFMQLMGRNQFHPVKISWEDIGRNANSCWGDRISDVGIWVRKDEADASSARLALSVRRSDNFTDKVLMVPADRIKIHQKVGGKTIEKTLPQRLLELGLTSQNRDRNVIVSNQFAIVPVPTHGMRGAWPEGVPPRAAFTFSIFPYGSTNYVITDVIEGSSDAVVGPGNHQLLFAQVDGQKAPFTASRAEDRPDLLRMEQELKAKGMDVDVQRYYLIQIPLRRGAAVQSSSMGTPPLEHLREGSPSSVLVADACCEAAPPASAPLCKQEKEVSSISRSKGLDRVAIGHGEREGAYVIGSGFQGNRAEEPIRVTVVYFVTPKGPITQADMQSFSHAFAQWDSQAIWGGSFVTK